MKLLIAEKPSVARTLKEMLERLEGERFTQRDGYFEGRTCRISWCIGHLVGLSDPDAYGWKTWRLSDLPMVPQAWQLQVLPGTAKQFRVLEDLMRRSDSLINGTDAGREGELIYGLVVEKAGCRGKPQARLWLNSFVPADIEKAWRNLIPGPRMDPLYQSALCRAKADWLVGMNLSRGYALGTRTRKLSVGRVQTPTLGLIVKRDLEIENWKDRVYHQLTGTWRKLRFLYVHDKETKFEAAAPLQAIQSACEGQEATLVLFEKQERRQYPPKPFDLAGLQKAANKTLGLKAATTLEIAQSLYEKKWVTYPRTDSQYLPEGMKAEAWATVDKVATPPEKAVLRSPNEHLAFFDSTKVSDHFAIIPTGQRDGLDRLAEKERKVFDLIRSRFVLAFGRPYEFEEYRLGLDCKGHAFKARATRELKPGFKALFKGPAAKEDSSFQEEPENRLQASLDWRTGETDRLRQLEIERKQAAKPLPYTEATLLSAMETAGKAITDEALREAMKERGLGTPATKAAIIEKLKAQEYILAQGKHLISTVKGRELIHLVDEKVASPEMTGDWEFKLNQIAKGKFAATDFLKEIIAYISGLGASYTSSKAMAFSSRIQGEQGASGRNEERKNWDPITTKAMSKAKAKAKPKEKVHAKVTAKAKAAQKSPSTKMTMPKTVTTTTAASKKRAGAKVSSKKITSGISDERNRYTQDESNRSTNDFTIHSNTPLELAPGYQDAPEAAVDLASKSAARTSKTVRARAAKLEAEMKPVGTTEARAADFGICPKCRAQNVVVGKFGYECQDWKGCGFKVYGSVAGRKISEAELKGLLEKRRTGVLEGFTSKAGNPFKAALRLNERWEVKFEFDS